jgi:anti-anti-sigma regulatory factor
MLRVTVNTAPEGVTLKLEGKLVGPWVHEAEACLQRVLAGEPAPDLRLDLIGLTMIDHAGKAFLSAAHERGAGFIASGCLIRAIIAELMISEKSAG